MAWKNCASGRVLSIVRSVCIRPTSAPTIATVAPMLLLIMSSACNIAAVYAMFTKGDRKSTRLNSSHDQISYAVFCLKKKKKCDEEKQSVMRTMKTLHGQVHAH